ncbi:MAG: glycoside hydrolase family 3 C-terminal domain-containing protein [Lachnospiraceae bacterium]|nr:glycoside hydrolase family 3 C-terminal domain-containing protein [Lachnospiraceae bacterium]
MKKQEANLKARELVKQMTREEKVSQMLYTAPAIERLGLPAYNWWNEALHGVARAGLSTVFPQSIALSASYDPQILNDVGSVVGEEGRLKNRIYRSREDRGIYKGLTYWSPNINIVRDPRWGRGHESYGEDPCLNAIMGVAFVKGIQEYRDPSMKDKGLQAAACAKHFAVHSGPEGIRHGFDSKATPKELSETYLPAFEKLVKDADVAGVMSSYNAVNGVPTSASSFLLRETLRDKWGFEGYTVSDCGAISDIYHHHHYKDTLSEAAAAAVEGGCDLNCGNMYGHLLEALEKGQLEEKYVDEAVERLLTIRFMLDMDEDPQPEKAMEEWVGKLREWKQLNRRIAESCIVLLKNDGILPLKEAPETIAIVGPDAAVHTVLEGNYHGTAADYVTVAKGIAEVYPESNLLISEGAHLYKDRVENCSPLPGDRISEAAAFASFADVTFAVVGLDPCIEGEAGDASNEYAAGDKHDLHLPASQQAMLEAVCEASDNVVVILMSGGALELGNLNDKVRAVIQGWYPGSEGGRAIANVICGKVNPTGRLPLTFYYNEQVSWDFSDYHTDGKTYRFFKGKPLYPFGFGIGYEYLTMESARRKGNSVYVDLKNQLDHPVAMPLQLYVKAEEEGLETPNFQLVAVNKILLEPGQKTTAVLEADPFWTMVVEEDGTRRPCRGKLTFFVGDHQPDERSEELCRQQGRQSCIRPDLL